MNRRDERLAVECLWLRRTIDSSRTNDPFVTLCMHIIREDQDCVGPFLDGMETPCLLWEPNARLAARLAAATAADE